MDAQTQKDFLASFFPIDISADHARPDLHPHPVFQYNPPTQQPNVNAISSQLNAELLGNLMSMQAVEAHSAPQPPYNPQLLLEQQFKLTQLQQLQQLQNQIFQQQARKLFWVRPL
jgi:hypothetical protein